MDDPRIPIVGGGPLVETHGSTPAPAPQGQEPAPQGLSLPLIVVRLSPEGFLEAAVNIPEDGLLVLYQDAAHIARLNATLHLGHALLEALIADLPTTARVDQGEPS